MLRIDQRTKERIIELKHAGLGVTDISNELGITSCQSHQLSEYKTNNRYLTDLDYESTDISECEECRRYIMDPKGHIVACPTCSLVICNSIPSSKSYQPLRSTVAKFSNNNLPVCRSTSVEAVGSVWSRISSGVKSVEAFHSVWNKVSTGVKSFPSLIISKVESFPIRKLPYDLSKIEKKSSGTKKLMKSGSTSQIKFKSKTSLIIADAVKIRDKKGKTDIHRKPNIRKESEFENLEKRQKNLDRKKGGKIEEGPLEWNIPCVNCKCEEERIVPCTRYEFNETSSGQCTNCQCDTPIENLLTPENEAGYKTEEKDAKGKGGGSKDKPKTVRKSKSGQDTQIGHEGEEDDDEICEEEEDGYKVKEETVCPSRGMRPGPPPRYGAHGTGGGWSKYNSVFGRSRPCKRSITLKVKDGAKRFGRKIGKCNLRCKKRLIKLPEDEDDDDKIYTAAECQRMNKYSPRIFQAKILEIPDWEATWNPESLACADKPESIHEFNCLKILHIPEGGPTSERTKKWLSVEEEEEIRARMCKGDVIDEFGVVKTADEIRIESYVKKNLKEFIEGKKREYKPPPGLEVNTQTSLIICKDCYSSKSIQVEPQEEEEEEEAEEEAEEGEDLKTSEKSIGGENPPCCGIQTKLQSDSSHLGKVLDKLCRKRKEKEPFCLTGTKIPSPSENIQENIKCCCQPTDVSCCCPPVDKYSNLGKMLATCSSCLPHNQKNRCECLTKSTQNVYKPIIKTTMKEVTKQESCMSILTPEYKEMMDIQNELKTSISTCFCPPKNKSKNMLSDVTCFVDSETCEDCPIKANEILPPGIKPILTKSQQTSDTTPKLKDADTCPDININNTETPNKRNEPKITLKIRRKINKMLSPISSCCCPPEQNDGSSCMCEKCTISSEKTTCEIQTSLSYCCCSSKTELKKADSNTCSSNSEIMLAIGGELEPRFPGEISEMKIKKLKQGGKIPCDVIIDGENYKCRSDDEAIRIETYDPFILIDSKKNYCKTTTSTSGQPYDQSKKDTISTSKVMLALENVTSSPQKNINTLEKTNKDSITGEIINKRKCRSDELAETFSHTLYDSMLEEDLKENYCKSKFYIDPSSLGTMMKECRRRKLLERYGNAKQKDDATNAAELNRANVSTEVKAFEKNKIDRIQESEDIDSAGKTCRADDLAEPMPFIQDIPASKYVKRKNKEKCVGYKRKKPKYIPPCSADDDRFNYIQPMPAKIFDDKENYCEASRDANSVIKKIHKEYKYRLDKAYARQNYAYNVINTTSSGGVGLFGNGGIEDEFDYMPDELKKERAKNYCKRMMNSLLTLQQKRYLKAQGYSLTRLNKPVTNKQRRALLKYGFDVEDMNQEIEIDQIDVLLENSSDPELNRPLAKQIAQDLQEKNRQSREIEELEKAELKYLDVFTDEQIEDIMATGKAHAVLEGYEKENLRRNIWDRIWTKHWVKHGKDDVSKRRIQIYDKKDDKNAFLDIESTINEEKINNENYKKQREKMKRVDWDAIRDKTRKEVLKKIKEQDITVSKRGICGADTFLKYEKEKCDYDAHEDTVCPECTPLPEEIEEEEVEKKENVQEEEEDEEAGPSHMDQSKKRK